MTTKLQIYKCNICGNLVQILQEGDGNLVCCGQEMELMSIQYDNNELGEKHTPNFEIKENKKYINVIGHPMTKEHYIQFIETISMNKGELYIKFFKPEDVPEMPVKIDGEVSAVEYCNIHNLWGNNILPNNEYGNYSI